MQQRIRGNNELFSRLFIALAEKYLHISFETTKFDGNVINIIRFELPATPELFELRQQLWEQIFRLYDDPRFQDRVLSAIYTYSTDGYRINTKEIIEVDATDDIEILKRAYFSVCKARQHDDYESVVFSQILDVDPNFILEYIDKMYEGEACISQHDNQRNFSFLWLRDDYERLMTEVVERMYSRERTHFTFDTCLQSFFILEAENKNQDTIRERQG